MSSRPVPRHPGTPPAEVRITEPLVRRLLEAQCPRWAERELRLLGEGWDNVMFRLGEELVVRLPRRQSAVPALLTEQRWMPDLAPTLPVAVPVPIRCGVPGPEFGWPWSVVPHLPGSVQVAAFDRDQSGVANQLADFFVALHRPAPPALQSSLVRGVPLERRGESFDQWTSALLDDEAGRASAIWRRGLGARAHSGVPRLLHGDPHPLNLLVDDDRLSGVIDFGDLTGGDPACDLGIAALGFTAAERAQFRARIEDRDRHGDDPDLWLRADAWMLYEAVIFAATGEPGSPEAAIADRALRTLAVRRD